MRVNLGNGIRGTKVSTNEIAASVDFNFMGSESLYETLLAALSTQLNGYNIQSKNGLYQNVVLSGLTLGATTGMITSLKSGIGISFDGYYLSAGSWSFAASQGDQYLVAVPSDTNITFAPGNGSFDRIDMLEIQPQLNFVDNQVRQIRDPITQQVTNATLPTKVQFTFNSVIKVGVAKVQESDTFTFLEDSTTYAYAGKYFLFSSAQADYYVWYTTGATADPAVAGRIGIPVTITGGMTTGQIATTTQTAISAAIPVTEAACSPSGSTITIVIPKPTVITTPTIGNISVLALSLANNAVGAGVAECDPGFFKIAEVSIPSGLTTIIGTNIADYTSSVGWNAETNKTIANLGVNWSSVLLNKIGSNWPTVLSGTLGINVASLMNTDMATGWNTLLTAGPNHITGIWYNTITYALNDVVTRLGKIYISGANGNLNNDPSTDNGTNWTLFKSGGSGGIQYVLNPDAESLPLVTDWNRYVDVGAVPVDGTGGSPNVNTTFAKNTSSPLFGTADFILTKDAANRQGEGVSTDFTVDRGILGQALSLDFYYKASANYADSDIGIYIYDVTNAILIYPSTVNLISGGGSVVHSQVNWNPTTSTSYRLIFHIQSVNATAWTFEIDNIQVSPTDMATGWNTLLTAGPNHVTGIWYNTITYALNDVVTRLGKIYISGANGNLNNDPSTDTGTNWQVFKSGGGGTTSYLINPDLETLPSVTGYNLYNDGAVPAPVNGAGAGTITLALSKNTTTPLFGTADLLMTKPASNCEGQGFSTDFTIDPAACGQPLSLTFAYKIGTSSGYTDNDIGVYIYDKTNSNLIYPTQVNLVGAGGSIQAYSSAFNPSTSTSYRLIFHVQGTDTTAYTFEVDNIVVAIQKTLNGAAISNWNTFPTVASIASLPGSWTKANYRRVGNNIELDMSYSATGAATGSLGFTLSTLLALIGLTSNTLTVFPIAGYSAGVTYVDGVWDGGTFYGPVLGSSAWTATSPFTWKTGDGVIIKCSIPISQWQSNINLATDATEYASNSSSTDTNDTTSFVYGSGGAVGILGVTSLTTLRTKRVQFTKPIQITDRLYIEIQENGVWKDITQGSSTLPICTFLYGGSGSNYYGMGLYYTAGIGLTYVDVLFGQWCWNAGTWNSTGALWSTSNFTSVGAKWRVRKVSNGNMAEVPPVVACDYASSAGNTIPNNAVTFIDFATKNEDTNSAVVGAGGGNNATYTNTWRFVAPLAGKYSLKASVSITSQAAASTIYGSIFVNGVEKKRAARLSPPNTVEFFLTYSVDLRLNIGDVVSIAVYQNSGASVTMESSNTSNWAQITRIGS